jgi:hypothetical protein
MINDERKALERAHATLETLTPATARDDAIAFDLRYASRHLADARAKGVAREQALNMLRADALNALSAVAVSLDRRTLTQGTIEAARKAVASLPNQLRFDPEVSFASRIRRSHYLRRDIVSDVTMRVFDVVR